MTVRLTGSLGLTLILGACSPGFNQAPAVDATEPVSVQVVYRGSRCPAAQPGIQVIRDADSWTEWQRQREQMFFSASNEPEDAAADLDFGQISVIVISMGQKPTPSYAVDVPEGSVTLKGTSLTISAVWQQPREGAILPQVITSPCIAITVPNVPYSTVKVENQSGDIVIDQPI